MEIANYQLILFRHFSFFALQTICKDHNLTKITKDVQNKKGGGIHKYFFSEEIFFLGGGGIYRPYCQM